ncbi:NlpC/P60 family protein [Streptosporangium subroseum]|uniref:C40 family peptidase n=1 Tax=Streptosporangium subroseum TaxID=106412 RepID=UPI00341DDA2D
MPEIDRTEPGAASRTGGAGSGGAPQIDPTGPGFETGDVRADIGPSAKDDGRMVRADGSSISESPILIRPPVVVPSAKPRASQTSEPRASQTSGPEAFRTLLSPESAKQSQSPSRLQPPKRSQSPSQREFDKRSQGPSRLTPAKRSQPPDLGQIAAIAALRQIGRPYVWGGGSSAGPTGGGFDCSGLALHAWSKAGATLTHYTGSQFKQGRRVPFSQLRPGDLVFFGGGTGDPAHVGVYVKDGVMVHAPKRGDVVRTTNFAASAYYRLGYRGAVRPAPR